MSKPIAYGIDFGTTNTVVAAAHEDRVELLPLGDKGSVIVPSVLLIDVESGNYAIGEPAWRQMMANPKGKRFVFAIKGALSEPALNTKVGGEIWDPEDFLLKVLKLLKRDADRYVGRDVKRVVLGHPVAFQGAEGADFARRQKLAMGRLKSAALRAGFEGVELMVEPAAAVPIHSLGEGNLLAVDFGGGTIDIMVARIEAGEPTARALRGAAIGGQRLDAAICRAFVSQQMGLERDYRIDGKNLPFPNWIRVRFESWFGLQQLMRDPTIAMDVKFFMRAPDGDSLQWLLDVLRGGQAHRFLRALEHAKVDLSTADEAAVVLDWPGFMRRLPANRRGFEIEIAEDISKCMDLIDDALRAVELVHDDVGLVVQTGGSAQVPLFRSGIAERFSSARRSDAPFFSSVATGLAEYAQECWS